MAFSDTLVLVGLMGTGKSTVGRIVAEHLDAEFYDSDEVIEERTGRTVREIFETDGEAAFRVLESEALEEALAHDGNVVAAAGGVVLNPKHRAWLADQDWVFWLRARPETIVDRALRGDHRPLLADDPLGVLRRMAVERAPLYDEVADEIIDIDDLSVDEVAEQIMAMVDEHS